MTTIFTEVEAALARGWTVEFICQQLHVTPTVVEHVRAVNERINALPDCVHEGRHGSKGAA